MDAQQLKRLLEDVAAGRVAVDQAAESLAVAPVADLGFAALDMHRALRRGFPEVVYCEGKQPQQAAAIFERLADGGGRVLGTRAQPEVYRQVAAAVPDAHYHEVARCITVDRDPQPPRGGTVLVIAAGTSDLPVAEEAAVTATAMGCPVARIVDVGVAGLHRLTPHLEALRSAAVLVVVAGMEGALPGVISGLVRRPVIAVPTSVGYGTGFGGAAALLGMLNSCSAGLTVVNIDNGFGAGYAAALMNSLTFDPPQMASGPQGGSTWG